MLSTRWIVLTFTFFYLLENIYTKEIYGFQEKYVFHNKEIVFDYEPIKNNTLLYAVCNIHETEMKCSIIFESFPSGNFNNVQRKMCTFNYQTDKYKVLNMKEVQLKSLFGNQVAFLWREETDPYTDSKIPANFFILSTIDMSTCKTVQTTIVNNATSDWSVQGPDFHIVPYVDTFDVFYYNDGLCGDMICGETRDSKGKIINGPVASYFPNEFFREFILVYPIKPGSSYLGHYLLSSKLRLVSSRLGEIKDLMDYPSGLDACTFSCNNGYLGFCWMSGYNKKQINCTQFNAKGAIIMNMTIELDYNAGTWMAMENLVEGGFLLQISQCDDETWCKENIDSISFNAVKVHKNGQVDDLFEVRGVDCNDAQKVKTDIVVKNNGDVCVICACYVYKNGTAESYINLMSKCVSNK